MKIVVYSKPNCMQCEFTKKHLRDNNIPFKEVNVYKDEEALNHVKELGFQSMPVVEVEGQEPFFGFRPDRLEVLI